MIKVNPNIEKDALEYIKKIQEDAYKSGLMVAQGIACDIIRREAPKYVVPNQNTPDEMSLSGLSYFVTSAIVSEADKFSYLRRNLN